MLRYQERIWGVVYPMTDSNATNTLTRLTVAAGIAGVAALFTIAPAGAVPAQDFNPSCADLAPEGEIWTEFKIDADPDDGSHDAGDGITVTVEHTDAATVAWTSTAPVAAFIVKELPHTGTGKVMKAAQAKLGASADGKLLSTVVKQKLG